jgi:hypothetical protein
VLSTSDLALKSVEKNGSRSTTTRISIESG